MGRKGHVPYISQFNFTNLFYSTWKMNTNPWVLFVGGGGAVGRKKEEGVGVETRSEHHSGRLTSTSLPGRGWRLSGALRSGGKPW